LFHSSQVDQTDKTLYCQPSTSVILLVLLFLIIFCSAKLSLHLVFLKVHLYLQFYNPKTSLLIQMGLSSLPAPSEGVLCILLVNTALSISIVKGIVRTILHIVGIHLTSASASPSSTDSTQNPPESFEYCNTSESYIEEFKNRTPAIRFDTVCSYKQPEHECSVCLNQFEPESEINQLSCGHLFHKVCLGKWLDYWNITCPLCRTPLLPEEEATCLW